MSKDNELPMPLGSFFMTKWIEQRTTNRRDEMLSYNRGLDIHKIQKYAHRETIVDPFNYLNYFSLIERVFYA